MLMMRPPCCCIISGATSFEHMSAPNSSLRTSAGCHRPAVDDLVAASDPNTVVEVEGGPDLARDEIESASEQWRSGPVERHRGMLIADRDLGCMDADRDGRPVLEADHTPADVDHHPVRMPADDGAADRCGALERQVHHQQLRLHQAIDAGLDLGDGG